MSEIQKMSQLSLNIRYALKEIPLLLAVAVMAACIWAAPGHAENSLIKFYQDYVSQVDGDRCPMAPSCSSYAKQAIEKHGLAVGWAMAFDRLARCGRDEADISPKVLIDGQTYVFDPVSANDFWWFEEKE